MPAAAAATGETMPYFVTCHAPPAPYSSFAVRGRLCGVCTLSCPWNEAPLPRLLLPHSSLLLPLLAALSTLALLALCRRADGVEGAGAAPLRPVP